MRAIFAAATSELRGKWQTKKGSKEDINVVRWEQLKNTLQSGKYKVREYLFFL